MKNKKRVWAILGVVVLLVIFCLPMVFAFGGSETSQALFRGAFGAAILVPIMAYIFIMAYRIFGKEEKKVDGKIQNIIFDVGNVLMDYDWQTYLKGFNFPQEEYDKIAKASFCNPVWNERDRGTLPEEAYVQKFVNAAPEYEADIREVMRRTPECISNMDYAQTWVKYLKDKGYHLYILSNYSHYMLEANRSMMSFLPYMDGAVFSCDVEMIKPEPEIYQYILEQYDLNPSETVFLDDRKENCQGAEKQGIHAIQFKSFKQAAAELEKLGVK